MFAIGEFKQFSLSHTFTLFCTSLSRTYMANIVRIKTISHKTTTCNNFSHKPIMSIILPKLLSTAWVYNCNFTLNLLTFIFILYKMLTFSTLHELQTCIGLIKYLSSTIDAILFYGIYWTSFCNDNFKAQNGNFLLHIIYFA